MASADVVCRLLYERLVILCHSHTCHQCDRTDGIDQFSAIPLCHGMDAILSHMKYCRAGMSCQVPGCPSARIIMSHVESCRRRACPVVLNLSKDRKRKIRSHLQTEVQSFSSVESACQNHYNQLTLQFSNHRCDMCAQIPYRHYSDLPLCQSVDTMLSHMKYCRAGMSCQVPGCFASRTIISHWKVCKKENCPLVQNMMKDRKQKTLEQIHQKSFLPSVIRVNHQTAKKYRQMLFVMLHAWNCTYFQKSNVNLSAFDLHVCQSERKLLKHTLSCGEGHHCKYPDCAMTRFIYLHYMVCMRRDCEVCWPLRSVIKQLCKTNHHANFKGFCLIAEGPTTGTPSNKRLIHMYNQ